MTVSGLSCGMRAPNGTKTGEDGTNEARAVEVDEFCNEELAVVETVGSLTVDVLGCSTGKSMRNLPNPFDSPCSLLQET